MDDSRFAKLKRDPRFKKPRNKHRRIVLDDRFKSILRPTKTRKIDKYGRRVSSGIGSHDLQRFYRTDDPSNETDYARGEGALESSDEELDDPDSELNQELFLGIVHPPKQTPQQSINSERPIKSSPASSSSTVQSLVPNDVHPTSRLAAVNLDWDQIKARDLFKIFTSVATGNPSLSRSQKVLSVHIYPSAFGRSRFDMEEREGPPKELFKSNGDTDIKSGAEYDEHALRTYQLERLRYYYAIISCDSIQTASYLHSELDGTELERSANLFDLSYVPEDMTFGEDFRDKCVEDSSSHAYTGVDFSTDALRHSRVRLTWDEDDPERAHFTRRPISKRALESADFRAYLASSDSESDLESDSRGRLRQLLLGEGRSEGEPLDAWKSERGDGEEMAITFIPGLTERAHESSSDFVREESTLEKYQRRLKGRKNQRKTRLADLELEVTAPPHSSSIVSKASEQLELYTTAQAGHSYSRVKRGKKIESLRTSDNVSEKPFSIDSGDQRFKAIYNDPQFAIDPSNPRFRRTKNMDTILNSRRRSGHTDSSS